MEEAESAPENLAVERKGGEIGQTASATGPKPARMREERGIVQGGKKRGSRLSFGDGGTPRLLLGKGTIKRRWPGVSINPSGEGGGKDVPPVVYIKKEGRSSQRGRKGRN